ncbi:MAG: acyl-CoA dehydrogenase family protein [Thermomicrobiales bacterium]|nr:acyl-CoA dehydrogenase family protein [Thermomicrobiales bacterium]
MEVGQISEQGREIKARAARFIEEELWPLERDAAERGALDAERVDAARAKARAAGFSNLNMPREVGGADLPMLDLVAIEEEAGKATNGLGFIVADRGPRELLAAATPEQVERWVLPVVRGETREAWAITEPGAGSDVAGIQATAIRDGDEWVLNGEKWFVTGGDLASYYIVLVNAEGEQTLFLVDKGTPGLELAREPHFMHDPYTSKHQELRLVDCRVPEANRVPGAGGDDAKRWFSLERIMIAARCCGAAERLIDLARGWALEREAFGRPIADYQAIQFMLADSLTELAAARLLTLHAATAWDRGDDAKIVHGKVAMAKLYASEMANRVADRAVQIFGGRGYMTENPAARYYRELRVDRIWEGTSEIQRLIIARGLLKRGAAAYLDGAVGAGIGAGR